MTSNLAYLLIKLSYLSESTREKLLLGSIDGISKLLNGFLMGAALTSWREDLMDVIIVDAVALGYPRVVGRTPCKSVRLSHCDGVGTRGVREGQILMAGIVGQVKGQQEPVFIPKDCLCVTRKRLSLSTM